MPTRATKKKVAKKRVTKKKVAKKKAAKKREATTLEELKSVVTDALQYLDDNGHMFCTEGQEKQRQLQQSVGYVPRKKVYFEGHFYIAAKAKIPSRAEMQGAVKIGIDGASGVKMSTPYY